MLTQQYSARLAELRRKHGYSQEELAERIGISRQAYGKWESGAIIPGQEKRFEDVM